MTKQYFLPKRFGSWGLCVRSRIIFSPPLLFLSFFSSFFGDFNGSCCLTLDYCFFFFNPHLRICLPILEREEGMEGGREREGETLMWERNINWLSLIYPGTRDWTCNLGICPDQELNLWPFDAQDYTQPTEPYGWGKDSPTGLQEYSIAEWEVCLFHYPQRLSHLTDWVPLYCWTFGFGTIPFSYQWYPHQGTGHLEPPF